VAFSQSLPFAWEPLTPPGVAAFARASSGRLIVTQFLVAVVVAAAVVWCLYDGWCPIVRAAIEQLPEEGQIRIGKLDWRGESPQLLAEGPLLALSVDVKHDSKLRSPAHVQVEFGTETFLVYSLIGYSEGRYPTGWIVAFNRKELKPWWNAWQPVLLFAAAAAVVAGLMLSWYALATLYALPVWLIAFFANRDLRFIECYRLAGAALMPGALLMAMAILLYGFGVLDLVGLAFVTAGHLVLGWIYLFVSPLFLPRATVVLGNKNPFTQRPGS
jgi:hypothetical protein